MRSMIDGLQKAYDKQDVQTIAIITGPALIGGRNVDTAMEQWIAHAVKPYNATTRLLTFCIGRSMKS